MVPIQSHEMITATLIPRDDQEPPLCSRHKSSPCQFDSVDKVSACRLKDPDSDQGHSEGCAGDSQLIILSYH